MVRTAAASIVLWLAATLQKPSMALKMVIALSTERTATALIAQWPVVALKRPQKMVFVLFTGRTATVLTAPWLAATVMTRKKRIMVVGWSTARTATTLTVLWHVFPKMKLTSDPSKEPTAAVLIAQWLAATKSADRTRE